MLTVEVAKCLVARFADRNQDVDEKTVPWFVGGLMGLTMVKYEQHGVVKSQNV